MQTPFCVQRYCLKVHLTGSLSSLAKLSKAEEEMSYHVSISKMYSTQRELTEEKAYQEAAQIESDKYS